MYPGGPATTMPGGAPLRDQFAAVKQQLQEEEAAAAAAREAEAQFEENLQGRLEKLSSPSKDSNDGHPSNNEADDGAEPPPGASPATGPAGTVVPGRGYPPAAEGHRL